MTMHQGFAIVVALLAFIPVPSVAGTLNGHPDALSGWTGTAPYDNGNSLTGTVDFAVFTASDFNTNFAGQGYAPGDSFVYTYQVENAGSDNFSALSVGISNPANTIGTFDIGDIDASNALFDGSGNAEWQFLSPEIGSGEDSWGLAFSSPFLPMSGIALVSDGGGSQLVSGIPTPSNVPEPTTLALLFVSCCGIKVLTHRSRNRGNSV